jgi:putative SOS response-associated peptidase YedK
MCNEHRNRIPESAYFEAFSDLGVPLRWAQARRSNLEPKDSLRIRDEGPVIRWAGDHGELELLPWAWAGAGGRPVFNFRAEGRSFAHSDRCLIPSEGFYEFTAPADPKAKRKDRWLITLDGEPWFWIAGLIREGAWALLTTAPGPDIAPFHDRQPVVLRRAQALDWLKLARPEVLATLPGGSFKVEKVGSPSPLAGEG